MFPMLRSARSVLLKSSVTSLACCLLVAGAHADVYKYKDEKGKEHYTDKPQFLPAERLSIKTESKSIVDLGDRDTSASAPSSAPSSSGTTSAAAKPKGKTTDSEGKAELCNKARKDYLDRMSAQRVYEEQPDGQKRFLSEKEIASSRASAKQAMETLCN